MNNFSLDDKNFLIISESTPLIDGICSRLRTQGAKIEFCPSGFQAISLLEEKLKANPRPYDLAIITDECEDMPPREILGLMRVNIDKHKLPILIFGKERDPDAIMQLLYEEANGYLLDYKNFSKVIEKIKGII